ncbi:AIM24 family protein [Deinococcus antarcticus]|uniref:AIM24 family protein n=1 Tax=Deinococcus antarcticus TaxID=1298767 RepID=A0ABV8A2P2_9DEIO
MTNMQPGSDGTYSLREFISQTAERDQPGEVFELESSKMLEVKVNGRIWSKLGAMVAYKGQLSFKREGTLEGGLMKALKRAVTQEMSPLAKIEGRGVAYLADQGKEIQILRLAGDSLNVNGNDLLAFEDSVQYDITMMRRMAGMAAGGLFSVRVQGHGMVAILSHGKPLTLRVTPHEPIFTDPNATIAWSGNLMPQLTMDTSFKSMLGRGGGETYQMVFQGDGFVVVQPYEEFDAGMLGGDSHSSGGIGRSLGDLFD